MIFLKLAVCLQQIFAKLKIDCYLIMTIFAKIEGAVLSCFSESDLVITF
jgi:hypothetical protein